MKNHNGFILAESTPGMEQLFHYIFPNNNVFHLLTKLTAANDFTNYN